GALQVAAGALTIGGVQAFIQFSRLFSQPIGQIGGMLTVIQSCIASAERVFALLDAAEIPAEASVGTIDGSAPTSGGRVIFEHVTFGYSSGTPAVLDLSFTAEPGQTVAIVGHTGAGKTTLVNLLMRFYELDSGRITIDGVDIVARRRDELRSMIGMVLQDAWLFTGTIKENIEYGRLGARDADIVSAAEATLVDHFVRSLPDGYATVLGNDGGSLSQGQRQLVTIARAYLAGRSILVLDEATSSVDTRTEVQIREAMRSLRQGRTSFIIAHRLSTVRDADVILVMDHGQIVEQGTHEELLAARGFYSMLYDAESRGREDLRPAEEPGL
ncbi:MAG: ABC transporter ATP-binding protein, partial [Arthrobacter sp.]